MLAHSEPPQSTAASTLSCTPLAHASPAVSARHNCVLALPATPEVLPEIPNSACACVPVAPPPTATVLLDPVVSDVIRMLLPSFHVDIRFGLNVLLPLISSIPLV